MALGFSAEIPVVEVSWQMSKGISKGMPGQIPECYLGWVTEEKYGGVSKAIHARFPRKIFYDISVDFFKELFEKALK